METKQQGVICFMISLNQVAGIQDYQKYCRIHGYEPFSGEEVAGMNKDREELIHSFGEGFKEAYGWASDILKREPKLKS